MVLVEKKRSWGIVLHWLRDFPSPLHFCGCLEGREGRDVQVRARNINETWFRVEGVPHLGCSGCGSACDGVHVIGHDGVRGFSWLLVRLWGSAQDNWPNLTEDWQKRWPPCGCGLVIRVRVSYSGFCSAAGMRHNLF